MIFNNIFSDPLSPESNTVWIYSQTGLASKLFVLNSKRKLDTIIKELKIRGADVSFSSVGNSPRIFNNLSAEAIAIYDPDYCQKYWVNKWKKIEDIKKNQTKLFWEIAERIKKARAIAKKRMA